MPRIPDAEIERVKHATDLLALVRSRGVELKKHGSKDWIGRCPFHQDRDNPNFIVSPDKGLFHCMVCGKAGNAIQFVQFHDGVSFRHAFEVLAHGQAFAGASRTSHDGPTKQSTVPKLDCPLALDADDVASMNQTLAYYRERLQQTPAALDYLKRRGIESAIEAFGIGFADRTLGLRLPKLNRTEGEAIRTRLQKLGLLRESGHEHFNGCVVFPIKNDKDQVTEIYGRKINDNLRPGTAYHLYLPGPHVGIFNRECLASSEIILCEAVIDTLTFWVNGLKNVTCIYGTEGFTDELLQALRDHKTRRVYLAYDRDDAGERAATRDAAKLQRFGIQVLRVKFPQGMDANEYARKLTPAEKSLRLLVNAAEWMGGSARPAEPPKHVAMVVDEITGEPLPIVDKESLESGVGWAPAGFVPAPYADVQAQSSSLAASVSSQPEAAKEEKPSDVIVSEDAGSVILKIGLGGATGPREWRARGVENNTSFDLLKVNLRLLHNERFHLDTLDLYQARQRQAFVKQAVEETGLEVELVQRDMAKVLLELEGVRDRRLLGVMQPSEPVPAMTSEEREEALAWLKAPDLIGRLREAFHLAGIIGEETNTLIAYLAGVSRKLERPLAIIIQSASAAGKTTLMDAVLSFFPE
ncbi:MAG: CHC2 zinc finger domain-containing protein, partial [Limisphaerales bacterium]